MHESFSFLVSLRPETDFNGIQWRQTLKIKIMKVLWSTVLLESDGAVGVCKAPLQVEEAIVITTKWKWKALQEGRPGFPQGEILRRDWHEGVISLFNLSRFDN